MTWARTACSAAVRVRVAAIRAAVLDAVRQWHRRAALAHHPDRGGSVATMQAINAAADDLAAEITRRLALYG